MFRVILKLQGISLTQLYKEYNDNVILKTSRRNIARDFEFFFFSQTIPRNLDIFRIQKGQTSEKNLLNQNRIFFFFLTKSNLIKFG